MKIKSFLVLVLLLAIFSNSKTIAQNLNKETRKKVNSSMAQAELYLANEQYDLALQQCLFAYDLDSTNDEIMAKTALCYFNLNRFINAIKFYEKALLTGKNLNPEYLIRLAQSNHLAGHFDRAKSLYLRYDSLTQHEAESNVYEVKPLIAQCDNALSMLNLQKVAKVEQWNQVNTESNDYQLIFFNDTLTFFTSSRPVVDVNLRYETIFTLTHKNEIKPFDKNTAQTDNVALAISPDSALIFYNDNSNNEIRYFSTKNMGKLYSTYLINETWSNPYVLSFPFNSDYNESSLVYCADGKTVYFTAKSNITGFGGKDIYFCQLLYDSVWSVPQNLGKNINTEFDEESVFISHDGNTLCFSSQGHNSIGGFDIFCATRLDSVTWSEPQNLGMDINSGGDELFFSVRDTTATFSSVREGGAGKLDLYSVHFINFTPLIESLFTPEILAFLQHKNEQHTVNQSTNDISEITNNNPLDNVDNNITNIIKQSSDNTSNKQTVNTHTSDVSNPVVSSTIDINNGAKNESLSENQIIEIKQKLSATLNRAAKISVIHFATNQAQNAQIFTMLDSLATFLKTNTKCVIQVIGNTDEVGKAEYNQQLSQRRANFVVNYLESKGVQSNQLKLKAQGETKPLVSSRTSGGQLIQEALPYNRRVEFVVIQQDENPLIVTFQSIPNNFKVLNNQSYSNITFSIFLTASFEKSEVHDFKIPDVYRVSCNGLTYYLYGKFNDFNAANIELQTVKKDYKNAFLFINEFK